MPLVKPGRGTEPVLQMHSHEDRTSEVPSKPKLGGPIPVLLLHSSSLPASVSSTVKSAALSHRVEPHKAIGSQQLSGMGIPSQQDSIPVCYSLHSTNLV